MKITYACGHTREIPLGAYAALCNMPTKEYRDEFLEKMENGPCPECYNKELKDKADEQWQLPALKGTPKQIAYAEKIRAKVLADKDMADIIEKHFHGCEEKVNLASYRKATLFMSYLIASDDSKFWIDSFYNSSKYWPETFRTCCQKIRKSAPFSEENMHPMNYSEKIDEYIMSLDDDQLAVVMELKEAPMTTTSHTTDVKIDTIADIVEQLKKETTLRPAGEPISTVVTEIADDKDYVYAKSEEKVEEMVDIVKNLHYSWDREYFRWKLKIGEATGNIQDRVVEVCRALLDAGLIVRVRNIGLLEKIENAEYEPAYPRWVIATTNGKLKIIWEYGQDFKSVVYKIPRAKVYRNSANIPVEEYHSVLDLAEEYKFRIAPSAQKLIDVAIAAEERQIVVNMKKDTPTPEQLPDVSTYIKMKKAGKVEIDQDLRDE